MLNLEKIKQNFSRSTDLRSLILVVVLEFMETANKLVRIYCENNDQSAALCADNQRSSG